MDPQNTDEAIDDTGSVGDSGGADTGAELASERFKGVIDAISGGLIMGWALDVDRPTEPLGLIARVGDSVVGRSVAGSLRPDLVALGIGSGHHGYSFAVDDLQQHAGRSVELVTTSGVVIATKELPAAVQDASVYVDGLDLDGFSLGVRLVSEASLGLRILTITDGDVVVAAARVSVEVGLNRCVIELAADRFDDREHLISVSFEGQANRLGAGVLLLRSVVTPWQYLQHHVAETSLASLHHAARSRYDALSRQIAHASPTDTAAWVQNLQRIHGVLVEGWEGRKRFPVFRLPVAAAPKVSIVVPAHNKLELTYHAVAAVALAYNEASYEIIVVDDASTDRTAEIESIIENLVVVRNETNLGFLRSVNKAVAASRGEFVFLLNNDTEVRSLFLDEALAPFVDPTVGMTGSKLINLDGTLQEAGGVVWGNGQPWNLGRNMNPTAPEWNYARDVDYVSGAALCLPKRVWEGVGGFSDEFAPAYYEDTDLAFKVRAAGLRTLYVPTSEVVHFEGQSNGRDVTKGIKRYQVVNEGTFRRKWMHAFRSNGAAGVAVHLAKDRNVDYRVLAIDYTTPNGQTDAGGYAAIREIEILQSLGCKVTFVPENLAHMGALTRDLQRRGVEVLYAPAYRSMMEVFDRRLAEFDAVYITRFDVAERHIDAIRARSKSKILLNNADLHFLRMLRSQIARGDSDLAESTAVRDRELGLMRKVDAVLTYNEVEQAIILSHNLKSDNIFICPWVLDAKPQPPAFGSREGIAFLGGYRHPPNLEAAIFLAREVMPELRRRAPGIKLYLYGSHAPAELLELEEDDIVTVGFVESLDDVYLSHRLFVAPLLSGAGIKGKVLEAMAYGTPSVLTPVAAEATGLQDGISAMVRSDAAGLAEAIAEAYADEALWNRLSERSQELARVKFSRAKAVEAFGRILGYVGCWPRTDRPKVGW